MLVKTLRFGSLLLCGAIGVLVLKAWPAAAVQFPNGKTAFDSPPRLVGMSSSFQGRGEQSTYHITLSVPENAGEPLKAIQIKQLPNVETAVLRDRTFEAYKGNRLAQSERLQLAAIGGETMPGETTVVFEQPVPSGSTVTVTVKAMNPSNGSVYQYGITAFPEGPDGIGQFLGHGRIHVYSD